MQQIFQPTHANKLRAKQAVADTECASATAVGASASIGPASSPRVGATRVSNVGVSSSSSSAAAPLGAAQDAESRLNGINSAGPSQAAAFAEGKQAVAKEVARSENTLHAVGRLIGNEDLICQIRKVVLATNPCALEYAHFYHEMRSIEDTKAWYAGWAHWSS